MFLKNTEQTLWMYSAKEWEQVLERTRTTLDEDQPRLFMHHVMAQAGASDIDKAGRVLIPTASVSSSPWMKIRNHGGMVWPTKLPRKTASKN